MITLWHNPRCSKSRQALALLEDRGVKVTVRKYLEDAPSLAELQALHAALGHPPVIKMMRPQEPEFKAAGLSKTDDNGTLLKAMAAHPKLIERPVAISGDQAILGRPPENVLKLA
ncbi:arsenate reductase (glutaredoxin) [Aestuariivita boseongensis]|jgi:arsenate reductase|uniref:arsenate reductase (glutaredoxin) n=1 Tax=Aestuariivita boseongensis TaxID=1470562 RepID=UPI000680D853|nr:arsenate reductase (glutaredoxin) [Aestuariivita boseongensis]